MVYRQRTGNEQTKLSGLIQNTQEENRMRSKTEESQHNKNDCNERLVNINDALHWTK